MKFWSKILKYKTVDRVSKCHNHLFSLISAIYFNSMLFMCLKLLFYFVITCLYVNLWYCSVLEDMKTLRAAKQVIHYIKIMTASTETNNSRIESKIQVNTFLYFITSVFNQDIRIFHEIRRLARLPAWRRKKPWFGWWFWVKIVCNVSNGRKFLTNTAINAD